MTTTNSLDGLLAIRNGDTTSRWNFQDAVGSSVSSPGGIGNTASLSFSFLTAFPSYFSNSGFAAFTALQKQAARDALASISDVIQVSFTEASTGGVMTFGMHAQPLGSAGFAYFPSFGYSFTSNNIITSVSVTDLAGDIWLNSSQAWTDSDFALGGSGYGTLLHEIGHALGLKHPFDGPNILDSSLDNTQYTVMSYTQHPNSLYRTVTETSPNHFSWQYEHIQPETLMPLDIVALQYLYGANTSSHSDNDTYTFETNRPFIKTLWDGGGNDSISVANFSLACVVDLREGHYSSINIPSDPLPSGVTEQNTGIYDGTGNLAIAYGVVIEYAVGGSGNDQLIGNDVANLFDGRLGADTMAGGLGNDNYVISKGDIVSELVNQGSDLIRSWISYSLVDTDGAGNNGGNVEKLTLLGNAAINGTGNNLNNILTGNGAANILSGNSGADKLFGGVGADTLTGGLGADTLTGGGAKTDLKADRFVFLSAKDSGLTVKNRDAITDFKTSDGDKIDLSAIDANTSSAFNDAFTSLKQGAAFSGSFTNPASLFFDQTTDILYANNDADIQADFSVLLTGVPGLFLSDFIL
jgi:serralysin